MIDIQIRNFRKLDGKKRKDVIAFNHNQVVRIVE